MEEINDLNEKKSFRKELLIYLLIIIIAFLFFLFFVPSMIQNSRGTTEMIHNYVTYHPMMIDNCEIKKGIFIEGGFAERPMCIINNTKYEYFIIKDNEKDKLILVKT